jgi:hypothetical protein
LTAAARNEFSSRSSASRLPGRLLEDVEDGPCAVDAVAFRLASEGRNALRLETLNRALRGVIASAVFGCENSLTAYYRYWPKTKIGSRDPRQPRSAPQCSFWNSESPRSPVADQDFNIGGPAIGHGGALVVCGVGTNKRVYRPEPSIPVCLPFADGFESGDTSAWSATTPIRDGAARR